MGFKVSNFKRVDAEAQWFDFEEDGFRLKIAPLPNPDFNSYVKEHAPDSIESAPIPDGFRKRKRTRLRARKRRDMVDNEELIRITTEAMGHHVLVGWEGFEDDDGNAIPYSPEKSVELLTNLPELADEVAFIAREPGNFVDPTPTEDEAGNSSMSSDGTSNTENT